MTARQIFETAVTLMFGEKADEQDYEPFWLNTLNWILAENFKTNNALRMLRGKEPLAEVPLILDMDADVEFEDEFTRYIFPMGCAGYIYTDDDKGVGANYKDKYEFERNQILAADYEDVESGNIQE